MCILSTGPHAYQQLLTYSLRAPGPHANAYRLLRGLQVGKPLLIEGPPGVGKTSLVTALAQASGHRLKRINLSEQTVSYSFSSVHLLESPIGCLVGLMYIYIYICLYLDKYSLLIVGEIEI